MSGKFNAERISRKAETMQWTGENTQAVMEFLAKHGMIGDIFNEIFILVRKYGHVVYTLQHSEWLVEGEDKVLRFYTDETYKLMYQPINDELERLRAFALEVASMKSSDGTSQKLIKIYIKYGLEQFLKESVEYKRESLKALV